MKLNAACIACMVKRQEEGIRHIGDEALKLRYIRDVLQIICEAGEDTSAPVVTEKISACRQGYFGPDESFDKLKKEYNSIMLEKEPSIRNKIANAHDSLAAAIKYARAGNYIDFGAMGSVSNEKLDALIDGAIEEELDKTEYAALQADLISAKELVYLTDNCGEIVFDKLLLEEIKKLYPRLSVTVIVRGKPVLNDATMEDARFVEITETANVIGNGTGIAGTDLDSVSEKAKEKIYAADVILAKGQGNFESLHGCGLNIYYLFLCKCDWFVRRFGLERYKGVFISETNQSIA